MELNQKKDEDFECKGLFERKPELRCCQATQPDI